MNYRTTTDALAQATHASNSASAPRNSKATLPTPHEIEQSALQAQRLATLGALAVGVAHEFNNLLTTIVGNAALARMEPETVRNALANIEDAASQAARLCLQLAVYGSNPSFSKQVINLKTILGDVAQLVRSTVGKRATLEMNAGPDFPCVQGDAGQVRQAILTLLLNALNELPSGRGVIRVATGVKRICSGELDSILSADEFLLGEYAFIEVITPGSGVPAEGNVRSLDILAMVNILRAHQGGLQITGPATRLLLPCGSTEEQVRLSGINASVASGNPRCTVLLADDEEIIRKAISRMLEFSGLTVMHAADGQAAVRLFAQNRNEIDAVLLDSNMPQMTGPEALRKIRFLSRRVPVILMSGYCEHDATEGGIGDPLVRFLQKPFAPADLRQTLCSLLDLSQAMENRPAGACA